MNKVLILLLLAIVIFSLWAFDGSFMSSSTIASASDTSAVIIAKADYVSVRAKIIVIPQPGTKANVSFADGSQIQVIAFYQSEVFLPKTGSSLGSFGENAPGGIFLNDQKPFGAAVVLNATDSFFSTIPSSSSGSVTVYWFKVQGNASVTVAFYGVGI